MTSNINYNGNPGPVLKQYRINPLLTIAYTVAPILLVLLFYQILEPAVVTPHSPLDFFALFWPRFIRYGIVIIIYEVVVICGSWRFVITLRPDYVEWTPLFGPKVVCSNRDLIVSTFQSQANSRVQISRMGEYARNLPYGLEDSEELVHELTRRSTRIQTPPSLSSPPSPLFPPNPPGQ
jgi:hypothetical protein